jgi:hypothetical protein
MRGGHLLLALIALLAAFPVHLALASANVSVDVPGTVEATLNGKPYLIQGSASVQGTLCLPTFVYASAFARYEFGGWYVNGSLVSKEACMSLSQGSYLAHYELQYWVSVYSSPPGLLSSGLWARAGEQVNVTLPLTLNASYGVRYVLSMVLVQGVPVPAPGGSLRLGVGSPINVEADYQKFVLVEVSYPNGTVSQFWVPSGSAWSLSLPSELPGAKGGSVLRLRDVLVIASTAFRTSDNVLVLAPDTPTKIFPSYSTYYHVTATSPQGVLVSGWYAEGDIVRVEAPGMIQLSEERRLVFVGWEGTNLTSPQLNLQVTGPLNLTARYVLEDLLTQESPLGSSSRFVAEGSTQALYFPPKLPGALGLSRSLAKVLVDGQVVQDDNGLVRITVREPTHVVAVYVYSLDLSTFAFLLLAAAALAGAYVLLKRRGKEAGPSP